MHGYGTYEVHMKQRLLNEILEQKAISAFISFKVLYKILAW
jgi:hypothetical protein